MSGLRPALPSCGSAQLLVAVVLDDDSAALAGAGERDLRAKGAAQILFDAFELGVGRRGGDVCLRGGGFAQAAHEFLGLPDREVAGNDRFEQVALNGGRCAGQRATVALGDGAFGDRLLDSRLQVKESHRVRHGGAGATDPLGDLVLRQRELLGQLPIGVGLLHGVEVGSLDVLDEGDGQLVAWGHLPDGGGHVV
jgi:hypothetical protein